MGKTGAQVRKGLIYKVVNSLSLEVCKQRKDARLEYFTHPGNFKWITTPLGSLTWPPTLPQPRGVSQARLGYAAVTTNLKTLNGSSQLKFISQSCHLQIQATLQSRAPACITPGYFHLVAPPSQHIYLKEEWEAGESWRGVSMGHLYSYFGPEPVTWPQWAGKLSECQGRVNTSSILYTRPGFLLITLMSTCTFPLSIS